MTSQATWTTPFDKNQEELTWTLQQTGGTVTGSLGFQPAPPAGYSFSASSVGGVVSGTAFTWTMTMTVAADPAMSSCVGTTTTFSGTAQIQANGTSMIATPTSGVAPCDPKAPGGTLTVNGTSGTFTKQ